MSDKSQEFSIESIILGALRERFVGQMITVEYLRKPRKCVAIDFGYAEMSDSPDVVFDFEDGHRERVSPFSSVRLHAAPAEVRE